MHEQQNYDMWAFSVSSIIEEQEKNGLLSSLDMSCGRNKRENALAFAHGFIYMPK